MTPTKSSFDELGNYNNLKAKCLMGKNHLAIKHLDDITLMTDFIPTDI